jgi:DNA-binding XRE family transcriptional regulator
MTCVGTATEQRRCLFSALLDRATRAHDLTRRQLAAQLGVAVGTVNNYYLGKVDPLNCRLLIQQRLAELNGSTVDELWRFYSTGDWEVIGLRDPWLGRPVVQGMRAGCDAPEAEEKSPAEAAGLWVFVIQARTGSRCPRNCDSRNWRKPLAVRAREPSSCERKATSALPMRA